MRTSKLFDLLPFWLCKQNTNWTMQSYSSNCSILSSFREKKFETKNSIKKTKLTLKWQFWLNIDVRNLMVFCLGACLNYIQFLCTGCTNPSMFIIIGSIAMLHIIFAVCLYLRIFKSFSFQTYFWTALIHKGAKTLHFLFWHQKWIYILPSNLG